MQEFQSNGICSPTSCVSEVDETKGIYACSEVQVLNITFEACDTMGTGEVLASTVMQYLQDMTAQSPERGRLLMLYNMLDPYRQGVAVNRDTFHATMKRWIVECSQDCMLEEDCQNAETENNRTHTNGNELSAAETEKAFHEGTDGLDHETSDLINRVADLQYANQKLSEQNSSLLRAVEMCEEANLQLTDEIVTLKIKLTSSQQSVLNAKSQAEELEEAKRATIDCQERACRLQTSSSKLQGSLEEVATPICGLLMTSSQQKDDFQMILQQIKSQEDSSMFQTEPEAMANDMKLQIDAFITSCQGLDVPDDPAHLVIIHKEVVAVEARMVSAPSIVFPGEAVTANQEPNALSQSSTGHVIDLVKDQLPDVKLSDKDTKKNLELLEEAKKVSERFFMRRGRRSTCSLSDSPTGVSPNLTPVSSPVTSRSSSLTQPPQIASDGTAVNSAGTSPTPQHLDVPSARGQTDSIGLDTESPRKGLVDRQVNEQWKISQGLLSPRHGSYGNSKEALSEQKENCDPRLDPPNTESRKLCIGLVTNIGEESPAMVQRSVEYNDCPSGNAQPQKSAAGAVNPGLKAPTKAHKDPKGACTAELKSFGSGPPLMRAVSWDGMEQASLRNGAQDLPTMTDKSFTLYDKSSSQLLKSTGYKDFPVQPVKTQKLVKLREENKLLRNQTMAGLKLPDLSETAEQERGPSPLTSLPPPMEEEPKEKSDVMPNISDVMLRKLKVLRSLPGSVPPLTEKEVENAFVQLSLAFRNDSYTLETRLRQAERERAQTEDNTDKELEDFKGVIKVHMKPGVFKSTSLITPV
ncbi:Protein MRVI1 [Acipenser ruthenus]|uniref:Protein MRVI1 n=1 Tax=Acipenser ruthenus TaxID=7906 RepID=A0A444TWB5_ACIRT|nr:Protein MRVI1 [Acipenser ruthenus]